MQTIESPVTAPVEFKETLVHIFCENQKDKHQMWCGTRDYGPPTQEALSCVVCADLWNTDLATNNNCPDGNDCICLKNDETFPGPTS